MKYKITSLSLPNAARCCFADCASYRRIYAEKRCMLIKSAVRGDFCLPLGFLLSGKASYLSFYGVNRAGFKFSLSILTPESLLERKGLTS